MVGVFLLVDIELSDVVPGANDNASGVATVLSLAEELDAQPPAQPRRLGPADRRRGVPAGGNARLRPRSPQADFDRKTTYFVNLDTVGHGTVRFEAAAGWVVTYRLDRRLVELCDAIATADREGSDRYGPGRWSTGFAADSMPPHARGLPGDDDHLSQRR